MRGGYKVTLAAQAVYVELLSVTSPYDNTLR